MDSHLNPLLFSLGYGQQLDGVAQLTCVPEVTGCELGDPLPVHLVRRHMGMKSQARKDSQLVGRIGARHVARGVRLSVAQVLRLTERLGEVYVGARHLGENIVGGAVDNRVKGGDIVGQQALTKRSDQRNAPTYAGLVVDGCLVFPRELQELDPVLGNHFFVCRDDMLAMRQRLLNIAVGGFFSPNELNNNGYLRVL